MASDLGTRAVLAPTMLLVVGGIYWLDLAGALGVKEGALSAGLLGLLGIGGAWEFELAPRRWLRRWQTLLIATAVLMASAFAFGWADLDNELYPLVAGTLVLLFPLALSRWGARICHGLERQGATLLGFIMVAWPMYLAAGVLSLLPSLLYVVLICKGGDIGGCCWALLGRRKLIPHISPGKTVEGALGSLATSVALAWALNEPMIGARLGFPVWGAIVTGVVLNFTTQTGDLIESLLKRRCGARTAPRSSQPTARSSTSSATSFSFCPWFLVLVRLT